MSLEAPGVYSKRLLTGVPITHVDPIPPRPRYVRRHIAWSGGLCGFRQRREAREAASRRLDQVSYFAWHSFEFVSFLSKLACYNEAASVVVPIERV